MAGVTLPDMRPWGRRALTIPPTSVNEWLRLAVWEMWMGVLVAITLSFGAFLIGTSPSHIVRISDLNGCYGPPPVAVPCERTLYGGGALDTAFTALCGLMLIGVALWFAWELWLAVEPKPITDDFLRLLHDSFGRDWRNPLKWPWSRMLWAYGFASLGVIVTALGVVTMWTVIAVSHPAKAPTARIHTSQSFRVEP